MPNHAPTFSSEIPVTLVQQVGTDETFADAALTCSQRGESGCSPAKLEGLIRACIEKRHGSIFEHSLFTFCVTAPIFVWREIHRHRIASYNEQSARYKPMLPHFYIPPEDRPLFKVNPETWKPMTPMFQPIDMDGDHQEYAEYVELLDNIRQTCRVAYSNYLAALDANFDPGIARAMMPVNTFSTGWITMNPRGLMNFFSLRVFDLEAKYPSYPLYEIEQVAIQMENIFAQFCPITHRAFCDAGRVAP